MRPMPLSPARHARLFELIRQDNLAEKHRETRLPKDIKPEVSVAFAKRAAQTLAARV